MNYQEAKKIIDDNWDAVNIYVTRDNPPHRILGTFISAEERSFDREVYIFNECNNEHKDNAEVLLDLNIFGYELAPYVVILMSGNNIIYPLLAYLKSPSYKGSGNDE